jgi:hypothetical protein
MANKKREVVPANCAFTTLSLGGRTGPRIRTVESLIWSTDTPRRVSAASIASVSSPSGRLEITLSPAVNAAIIKARLATLLLPGTRTTTGSVCDEEVIRTVFMTPLIDL